jgi:hypothetical protein
MKDIMVHLDAAHLYKSIPLLLASLGIGGFFTVVGGLITAWMAKTHQVKNATVMGLVSIVLGLPFWGSYPLWYNVIAVLVVLGAAATGGYFAKCIFVPHPPPAG